MRRAVARTIIAAMSGPAGHERVRLMVDLDLAATGLSGRLVDEQGSVRTFFGWLELMDGLEVARERAAERGPAGRLRADGERASADS